MTVTTVYRLPGNDPWENLAVEEQLLDSLEPQTMALVLYVNRPCVVLGKHQNPLREVRLDEAAARGLPVIRRASGGGTVYHDEGNLNWSFLVEKSQYSRGEIPLAIARALQPLGFDLEVGALGDLLWNGKKVSGTASLVRKDRVLHHGTLLCRARLDDLHGVLGPTGTLHHWVGVSSRPASVVNLGISVDAAARALFSAFPAAHKASAPAASPLLLERLHGREWTWDETPVFEWEGTTLLGPARVRVSHGQIEAVQGDRTSNLGNMVGMPFFVPQLFPGMSRGEVS